MPENTMVFKGNRKANLQLFLSALNILSVIGHSMGQTYFIDPEEEGSLTGQQYLLNYQPGYLLKQYPAGVDRVVYHLDPGLGSHHSNVVLNYVKDFAGTSFGSTSPVLYNLQNGFASAADQTNVGVPNEKFGDFSVASSFKTEEQVRDQPFLDTLTGSAGEKPGYFLPSDALSLPNHLNTFHRNFEIFKLRKAKPETRPTNLAPIGGSISDYILLRNQPSFGNFVETTRAPTAVKATEIYQQIKRESPDDDDSVIIDAEALENSKNNEEPAEHKETGGDVNDDNEEQPDGPQPGIAQSKPSALALAGVGGVAHASPVATAVVGERGLAVSAPSGTAVAGTKTQEGAGVQLGKDKQKPDKKEDIDLD